MNNQNNLKVSKLKKISSKETILFILILIEFAIIFYILRYGFNVSSEFMLMSDDGYYESAILMNEQVFHQGPGWMNYAMVKFYKLFPIELHPYVAVIYRALFLFTTLFLIRTLYCKNDTEKIIIYIVFMFPLLFYFVFKPGPEIFMMPFITILIYQLSYDKLSKWYEYIIFIISFFIISQMKPSLAILSIYAAFVMLKKKKILIGIIILILLFGNYWLFKQASHTKDTPYGEKLPELSIVVANGLRNKQFFMNITHNKINLNDPQYFASIMDKTWPEMEQIIEKECKTNIDVLKYLLKNPDLIVFQIIINFLHIFGGTGRLGLNIILFLINFPIYIITFILVKKQNKTHLQIFKYCLSYLLFFLLLNVRFRYVYPILPIIYFLFATNVYYYWQSKKELKNNKVGFELAP